MAPCPDLIRIHGIETGGDGTTQKGILFACKVPIDFIRVIFVLDERAVYEDAAYPRLPHLSNDRFEIVDKKAPLFTVPGLKVNVVSCYLKRCTQGN